MIPANCRAHEPVVNTEVGEELHYCAYCDSRTFLDEATHYACGARNHDCPHCGQRYSITDAHEDDMNNLEPAATPAPHANGDAIFDAEIKPLIIALQEACQAHNFPVLTAVAFTDEQNNTIVHAHVQGNTEGAAPYAFHAALNAMSDGAAADPAPATQEPA